MNCEGGGCGHRGRRRGSRRLPGSETDPGGEVGCGRASLRPSGAQRGRLTCVACSRTRTSRIRKGSKPRPAVQKKRAPAAGPELGSPGPAAMAARARPRGPRVTWPRARAARPRALRGGRTGVRGGWVELKPPSHPAGSAGEGQAIWAWPRVSHLG